MKHAEHMKLTDQFIREGRTVSGGKDNPPDRYKLVTLTGNINVDEAAINAYADQEFRFVASIPQLNYVLMGNYKENK